MCFWCPAACAVVSIRAPCFASAPRSTQPPTHPTNHILTHTPHHSKERRLELIRDDWGPQQRALKRAGADAGGGGGGGGNGQKKAIDLLAPLGPAPSQGAQGAGAGGGAGKKGAVRRLDEAGIRTALFRLFEERRAWRVKELVARTGQGEGEVKAVLKGIADGQAVGGGCGWVCVAIEMDWNGTPLVVGWSDLLTYCVPSTHTQQSTRACGSSSRSSRASDSEGGC